MARNWQSGRQTGLLDIVNAYNEGEDRNRAIAKEKANDQAENSRWAFTNTKNYQKPKTDAYGFTNGFEDKQDTFDRNKPILEKLKPEYFRDPPAVPAQPGMQPQAPAASQQPAQDYTKSGNQELTPSGRPLGKTYDETGNRQPQGQPGQEPETTDPKPLLRDPKAAQQEAQLQHQEKMGTAQMQNKSQLEEKRLESGKRALLAPGSTGVVKYNPNDKGTPGTDPKTGKPVNIVNASGTQQQFDEGVNVLGPADASETIVRSGAQAPGSSGSEDQNPNKYNPDPYMMGRITDLATSPTPRASDAMISVSSLPPALLAGTGLEGFKGQLPSSLLKDVLSGKTKLDIAKLKAQGGGSNGLSAEQIPFVQMVDKGTPPGDALEAFQKQYPGAPIPKPFSDALYKSQGGKARKEGQVATQGRFEQTQGRVERTAYMGIVGKAADQWKKGAEEILAESQYARNAKKMANSGDTVGMVGAIRNMLARASAEKGPLSVYDVKQFGGAEGWAETAEQWLNKGANEGMTPENIAIVNRLADIYLKAANEKAKSMAKPIMGGLRSRSAAYGLNPDEAEDLFRHEMDMDLGAGDAAAEEPPAKKPGGSGGSMDPKSRLDATLKAIEGMGYKDPTQKRQVIKQAHDAYQAELKKAGGP